MSSELTVKCGDKEICIERKKVNYTERRGAYDSDTDAEENHVRQRIKKKSDNLLRTINQPPDNVLILAMQLKANKRQRRQECKRKIKNSRSVRHGQM